MGSIFKDRENTLNLVNNAKKNNSEIAVLETQEVFPWRIHYGGLDDYQKNFGELWHQEIFPTIAIDIMGNGEYIRNLQNEGHTQLYGLGVELSDTRHEEDKLFDGVYGNDVVVGDILEKVTWDNIRKKLKGASPDFIVCNGE